MDHSESDIAELVSNNLPRTKSQKELSTIIRYLFENPKVNTMTIFRILELNLRNLVNLAKIIMATISMLLYFSNFMRILVN